MRATQGSPFAERILGGTYRIGRRIDGGAMGTVFEAEHLRLHRSVAVKVLAPGPESRSDLVARFRQEAEIMSQLEHPHIVTVLDFDVTEQGEPYLVLERLHGETLESRIDREAPLAVEDAVKITTQVASALSVAHRASIVHRDLKPSNIFLTEAPGESVFAKLLDFGISKNLRSDRRITQARVLVGTPEYMAPEQATGRNDLVDPRTDQYALAVVAYEMLTGVQPFLHGDLREILGRVTNGNAAPPSTIASWVPAEVDGILARALSKDPALRFPSVMDFAREFAAAACAESPSPSLVIPSEAPKSGVRIGTRAPADEVAHCLERARASLAEDAVTEAAAHAEAAIRIVDSSVDPAAEAVAAVSEPLLAHIFMRRLGSPARLLFTTRATPQTMSLSSRAAFLLSRIEDGMAVGEILDVAWMPRLEALRWLVQLVACGAVQLGSASPEPSRNAI